MNYPKWLYHATEKPVVVQNAEEHEALGEGWHESPVPESEAEPEPADQKKKRKKE